MCVSTRHEETNTKAQNCDNDADASDSNGEADAPRRVRRYIIIEMFQNTYCILHMTQRGTLITMSDKDINILKF